MQEHVSGSGRHRETVLKGKFTILLTESQIFGWLMCDVVVYAAEMQEFAVDKRGVVRQGLCVC